MFIPSTSCSGLHPEEHCEAVHLEGWPHIQHLPPCFETLASASPQRAPQHEVAWGCGRYSSQYRDLAAVEIDSGALQPGGARRHHEGDEIGDVVHGAEARDAGLAAERGPHLVLRLAALLHGGADAAPLALGLDQARMDAVDPHAVLLAEVGKALGERRHRGVDRTADGEALLGLAAAGAADRDQRALACLQQRPGGARQPHMGEELERVAVGPVLVGECEEIAALGGTGIVDQNVETAELALHGVDDCGGRLGLPQIDDRDCGLAPLGADRRRDLVERAGVARSQHQVAAFVGEGERNAAADAAACSGHQRDFPLEAKLHPHVLLRRRMRLR